MPTTVHTWVPRNPSAGPSSPPVVAGSLPVVLSVCLAMLILHLEHSFTLTQTSGSTWGLTVSHRRNYVHVTDSVPEGFGPGPAPGHDRWMRLTLARPPCRLS